MRGCSRPRPRSRPAIPAPRSRPGRRAPRDWAQGCTPKDLPALAKPARPAKTDVFVYFIAAAKERNPAAAQALIKELGR